MNTTIRVLVADDQRVVREGLGTLLGLLTGVEVVGTAANGDEAVMLATQLRPDVVLMDLRMPRMDGAQATRAIRDRVPAAQVLVLTTYADDESLFPALQAGARGYLTKDASAEEIEHAIRAVSCGHTHLDPAIQQRLVSAVLDARPEPGVSPQAARPEPGGSAQAARRERDASAPPAALPDDLTPREAEVLGLIAAGLSNAEIAEKLVVSGATVKTHVNRIFYKTGARDRAQAVRYAYEHRLG